VGLNHNSGEPVDPEMEGIFDNYIVKRQIINSGYVTRLILEKEKYNCFVLCVDLTNFLPM
jgi:hypothetical protein